MTLNDRMNLLIADNEQLKAKVAELEQQTSNISKLITSNQPDENICQCCSCGYEWIRGKNGGHSCSYQLQEKIRNIQSILTNHK